MLGIHATRLNRLRFIVADWVLNDSKPFYVRNPLTCLPTREAFNAAVLEGGYIALFIDLDNLKKINREHGYQAGDEAIVTVSKSIIQHVRKTDLVSHWGGDEFAVLLYNITSSEAEAIAKRILAHINRQGYGVSIGIGDTVGAAQSCQQAAKEMGKNRVSSLGKASLPNWVQNQYQTQGISQNI